MKKLTLENYLDSVQLLQIYNGTHEKNRAFALNHPSLANNPVAMVKAWVKSHRYYIAEPLESERYCGAMEKIRYLLAFVFLVLGVFVGVGLLSYNGDEPVNSMYYLFAVIVIPLFGMALSLVSIFGSRGFGDFLSYFLPLYWIEMMFERFLPHKEHLILKTPLPPLLQKWFFIERMQSFAIFFSVGVVVALLFVVIFKDIAFGWSTTLIFSEDTLHSGLLVIATLWQDWFASAIPSVELLKLSQFYRLGGGVTPEMITHADKMGEWWKFLLMCALVYAIGLRTLFWIGVRYGYDKQLQKSFLAHKEIQTLIHQFTTPHVSTQSNQNEAVFVEHRELHDQTVTVHFHHYTYVLGWNFTSDEMVLANDTQKIEGQHINTTGGTHSVADDDAIATNAHGKVLLYIKSWEPPMMDFLDFLEMLIENQKIERIEILPLGTLFQNYQPDSKAVAVWRRKIETLEAQKVWIIDEQKQ